MRHFTVELDIEDQDDYVGKCTVSGDAPAAINAIIDVAMDVAIGIVADAVMDTAQARHEDAECEQTHKEREGQ